jgi:nucleoside-diphosphate-sugar epimerase
MEVLLAGATSTLGGPVLRELRTRGHDVVALTRSEGRRTALEAAGAGVEIGDVHDRDGVRRVLDRIRPEAVVSLLIALPKRGPLRMSDFKETQELWRVGVPNLLAAAEASDVRRFVAESVIFAYGYGNLGPRPLEESTPAPGGGVARGQEGVLRTLRGMERAVLESHGLEGVVLRYGAFHGPSVPSSRLTARLARRRLLVLPGGGRATLSWIHVDDAARATVDALERGRAGQLYNVVDDEPVTFRDYAYELARAAGARRPRSVPMPLARLATPYAATILGRTQLPVSNAKAKAELGWTPAVPSYREAAPAIAAAVRR